MTVGTLALCVLVACGARGAQPEIPTITVEVELTSTPVTPSPIVNYKDAAETQVEENFNSSLTEVALTHAPTRTIGPPPEYPSPTPELGLFTDCLGRNSRDPDFVNCWRGVVNGQIVNVWAGREGLDGDPTWGIIMVNTMDRPDTQLIRTPWKVGAVRIVSISDTLFTLAPIDLATPGVWLTPWATTTPGVTFVFDIITREWVSPPPSPTITVTPVLSPSPIPSPSEPPIPTTPPLPSPSP